MSIMRLFCRGYALSNKQSPVLVNIPAAMDVLKEETQNKMKNRLEQRVVDSCLLYAYLCVNKMVHYE